MKSEQYKEAEKRINDAYDDRNSPHYRDNIRFRLAVNSLNRSFREDPESVACGFCSFHGERSELEANGHCPKCQSPSTKNKDHGKKEQI